MPSVTVYFTSFVVVAVQDGALFIVSAPNETFIERYLFISERSFNDFTGISLAEDITVWLVMLVISISPLYVTLVPVTLTLSPVLTPSDVLPA